MYDSFHSDDPDAFNPIYIMPKSIEEFRERERLLAKGKGDMTLGTTGVILLTLVTAAPELAKLKPVYREAIYEYIDYARKNDLRCAESITDAKGHRKRRPSKQADPDFYVHVVDRDLRRRVHQRLQDAHQRLLGRPRAGGAPDQGDAAGRGGVRHRLRRAGQRAGRQRHRHHLRAVRRAGPPRTSRSAGIAARPKAS